MAFFGFSFAIPGVVGTFLAGLIMDNSDPRIVWYAAGILGLVAAGMYLSLHGRTNVHLKENEPNTPEASVST
jgi:MFS family permease